MTPAEASVLELRKAQAFAQFEQLQRSWYADPHSRRKAQAIEDANDRWKHQLDYLEPGCAYHLKVAAGKKVREELGL